MNNIGMDIQTSKEHPPLLLPLHDVRISDFSDIRDVAKTFTTLTVEKLYFIEDFDIRVFHEISIRSSVFHSPMILTMTRLGRWPSNST